MPADYTITDLSAQTIYCLMGSMTYRAILLKPKIVQVYVLNFWSQKVNYYASITLPVNRIGVPNSIEEKTNGSMMPSIHNPHKTFAL